ncbi:MAG: hypothetical protein R2834_06000 [Rhodothermales bacterium]
MHIDRFRCTYLAPALLAGFLISACSGPQTLAPADLPREPAGPTYSMLVASPDGLLRAAMPAGTVDRVGPAMEAVVARSLAPSGAMLAVAFTRNDSTYLAVVTPGQGAARTLPLAAKRREVTMAWRPDEGALVAGYYTPDGDAPGPGGMVVVETAGMTMRPSGCTASRIVYGWPTADRMLVGDGKSIYLVEASGCATTTTFSLLKKHQVTPSPTGRHVAYIFRELEYNREKRTYEPDSTLMIAELDGSNERPVAGERYHPRNLAWSPDGSKLAFDVTSQTDPSIRHLAVYDLAAGEATFIVRATDTVMPSETRPQWSPDGRYLAYDRTFVHGELYQKGVRSMDDNAVYQVAEQPRAAGKLDLWGWAGNRTVLRTVDGHYLLGIPGQPIPEPLAVDGALIMVW